MKRLLLPATVALLSMILTKTGLAQSQPVLQNDYSYSMEIPSVVGMESTPAHMYILSDNEGMAVFRTHADSLQWLYTAAGMQQRGQTIRSDIRFAYLFGDSRRLTVLEPTSVMGAFSATTLPARPRNVARVDDRLYVALGEEGLGWLSLQSPDALDSEVTMITEGEASTENVIDIQGSSDRLYALTASRSLLLFNKNEGGISYDQALSLDENLSRIFYVEDILMGTNDEGDIYEISSGGSLSQMGSIGEPVTDIIRWGSWLLFTGTSHRVWSSYQLTEPALWKSSGDAGNYLSKSEGQLWISEYDRISRVQETTPEPGSSAVSQRDEPVSSTLEIEPIADQVIPSSQTLLIPLKLKGNYPVQNVTFNLQADPEEAKVRGQSLYWQPESGMQGEYRFKVIASTPDGQNSSTSFTVDVRPFNSPPRFTPLRTISIPVGRPFTLPITATDPDATDRNVIRYIGVNLPEGADIDEQSGEFSWTPTAQQVGTNSFRVIATDQYGAASSADVTIRVVETNTGQN